MKFSWLAAFPVCFAFACSTPGVEGQPCYGNGTCDDGLTCASNLCVLLAEGEGDVVGEGEGDVVGEGEGEGDVVGEGEGDAAGEGEGELASTSTVTVTKTGSGIVRSEPAAGVCDVDCDALTFTFVDLLEATIIAEPGRNTVMGELRCESADGDTLTGVVAAGQSFATLTLPTVIDGVGEDWACTADFPPLHTLQVIATQGDGHGRVTGALESATPGVPRMDCASSETCQASYLAGDIETLVALPDADSVFDSWDFWGEADPTNPIQRLEMTADENCRPRFVLR